jgi:thioredoxin 1
MLQTNLKHILSSQDLADTVKNNEHVMVCCGRMGPMCIPVYEVMTELQREFPQVAFRDMEFDAPDASAIRNLPECKDFRGLPFTVYYKNGAVVKATTSIQTKDQVMEILQTNLGVKAVPK